MLKTLLVLACLTLSIGANAAIVELNFQGTIDAGGVDPLLTSYFSAGDTLTGAFTYDSDSGNDINAGSNVAQYENISASLSFSINSFNGTRPGARIVINNFPGIVDRFRSVNEGTPFGETLGAYSLVNFIFELEDPSGTALSSEALPLGVELSDFSVNSFSFQFSDSSQFPSVTGTFNSLTTVSSIPIPAAAWLFGSALLGLSAVKQKK